MNVGENKEDDTSGGQQSFDVQRDKNNDDEVSMQQPREDKGEIMEKEKKKSVR